MKLLSFAAIVGRDNNGFVKHRWVGILLQLGMQTIMRQCLALMALAKKLDLSTRETSEGC